MTTPVKEHHHTRARILDAAVRVATKEGLASLSFGRLADAVQMSKSGLFAHFGSRDMLLADVVVEAERRFVAAVLQGGDPASIVELRAMMERFVRYCAGLLVDDGAFLATAVREGEGLPKEAHARLRRFAKTWSDALESGARRCIAQGQLRKEVEPETMTFGVLGFGLATAYLAALEGSREAAFARGRRDVDIVLRDLATEAGVRLLDA